jgi:ADP-ribosyl-[dinitrogen reductase] hydrolase
LHCSSVHPGRNPWHTMDEPANNGKPMERRAGAVVGLAVGDALGAAVEFRPPGTFAPVTTYRGGGPHGLEPGEWTDDTSMALALADSILEVGWDLSDQAGRYLEWWRRGRYSVTGHCFDIGNTVSAALSTYEATGDPTTSGPDSEHAAGNGSIMRLAPVPAAFVAEGLDVVVERSVESSLPTHRAPQTLSACAYLGAMLASLMKGENRTVVLHAEWPVLDRLRALGLLHPTIATIASGSFSTKVPPQIRGTGYVVDSLEAALWAFNGADTFEDAVLAAVNLGDDADTTGAVCGQVAGAFWGLAGIPKRWRTRLADQEMIHGVARRLASMGPAG